MSVRIQVGAYRALKEDTPSSVQQQRTATEIFDNGSLTIKELCDSSYAKRRGIKRKGRFGEGGEEASLISQRLELSKASTIGKEAANRDVDQSGPRVEIVNGKIVVIESSLVINNSNVNVEAEYEEVVEGIHATATYASFRKRRPSPTWGIEETRLFYQALRQCGTDFTMMQAFFPGRTRDQLKKKFFREEHRHPELIKQCLNAQLPLELTPFEAQLGKFGTDLKEVIESNSSGGGGASNVTGNNGNSSAENEGSFVKGTERRRRKRATATIEPLVRDTAVEPHEIAESAIEGLVEV